MKKGLLMKIWACTAGSSKKNQFWPSLLKNTWKGQKAAPETQEEGLWQSMHFFRQKNLCRRCSGQLLQQYVDILHLPMSEVNKSIKILPFSKAPLKVIPQRRDQQWQKVSNHFCARGQKDHCWQLPGITLSACDALAPCHVFGGNYVSSRTACPHTPPIRYRGSLRLTWLSNGPRWFYPNLIWSTTASGTNYCKGLFWEPYIINTEFQLVRNCSCLND